MLRAAVIGLGRMGSTYFAPVISPYAPYQTDVKSLKQPPSAAHWLGTDGAGRDVLSRLIFAARIPLSVGLVAAGIALLIGTVLGLISGYYVRCCRLTFLGMPCAMR